MTLGFRISSIIHLIVVWCALKVGAENVEIVTPENTKFIIEEPQNVTVASNDSYVRAYREIQKLRLGPFKRNDYYEPPENNKQGGYNTVIRSSYVSEDKYPSLTHHWMPMHAASPPTAFYGAPHSHHFHDVVPPTQSCHSIPYSSPSSSSFLGFLPKKLTFKILLKILLKLVLFKMIVKFIAVICLLLFIPTLKSKETPENDGYERKKSRELDMLTSMIWENLEDKNSLYGEDEEMQDIREIAEEVDDDEKENTFSSPLKAVRFLEFCVSTVDRVVGYILGVLKRQRNEGDDLSSFILEKFDNFVKNL